MDKMKTKTRADGGMHIGIEERVILENLPPNATTTMPYNILNLTNDSLDCRDVVASAKITQAFEVEEGVLASTVRQQWILRQRISV